ncbi:unnamed protein product [Pieris brassicae]|uniref:Pro-corazonin n=1 Tax=Pieris brassicae TaxID=7116 RepID=A0A9P0U0I1_PIEBR|nr:unnamed protein product [Pieris brassicae]
MTNITFILIAGILTTVACQTFQYSRGWTNGKRDHKRDQTLDQILTPCQMQKLKYLLQGKAFSDRLLIPCDYTDEDSDQRQRYQPDVPDSLTDFH